VLDSQVFAFAVAAAALTLAPGPDTMLVIRNVLRGGRRDGVITTFGVCSGLFVHATLSALGVSVLLMHSVTAFAVLKFAGAVYLGWLGFMRFVSASRSAPLPGAGDDCVAGGARPHRCFVEGALSNILNPKTAVFYLAFLPQFVRATDPVLKKSLLLASIHYSEAIAWLVVVSVLADRMRRLIVTSSFRRCADGVCGTLLIAFGLRLALDRR
jgi:RhtB (resistance to homoserine/threonine) family protein